MALSTKLGEARGWRSDLRANDIPRRPEPDRGHVDGARREVMTTADKPPVILVQPAPAEPMQLTLPPGRTPARRVYRGRQFYTPEFQAEVVADYRAARAREPQLKQKQYCDRLGINSTTLSNWTTAALAAQRAGCDTAARAALPPAAPPPVPVPVPEPTPRRTTAFRRGWQTVSRELAEADTCLSQARTRVDTLKAELREILDAE